MSPLTSAALALALTTSTDTDAVTNLKPDQALLRACQQVCVARELLDEREKRYVFTREEEFATDLKLVRRRNKELDGAPPLDDCWRFPPRDLVNDLLSFNRAYRSHLDARISLELTQWWELRQAVQETDRLYHVWDLVRDARCDYYYVTVRRQALAKLRDTLGAADYYTGALPPHVPIWRFVEIRP
jgi:hypothetical protein